MENFSKIINEVNKSESLSKIISFYIWKIIYYKNNKNMSVFIEPNYIKKYKLSEYKHFQKIESSKNPIIYDYKNNNDNVIYNKFCEILDYYKENKFENINIEKIIQFNKNIDIFYFASSNLILSDLKQQQFLDSLIYENFYKNFCIPLFKSMSIFDALNILYSPQKFKNLKEEIDLSPYSLDIFFILLGIL